MPTGFQTAIWATCCVLSASTSPLLPASSLPPLWGTEDRLRELLGEGVSSLDSTRRTYVFRYLSADHFIEQFRSYYGPVHKAFESLDEDGREALENDLKELIGEWNISDDETAILPSDYLEVVAVRR